MAEDAPTQSRSDALAEPRDIVEAGLSRRREQYDDAEHGHQGAIKPSRISGGKPLVNHRSQSLTDTQHGHGSNHQGDGRKQYAIAVRLEQSQDNAGRSVLVGHGSVS